MVAAHGAACAITALILVIPYLFALGGVPSHARDALEFAGGEGNQWLPPLPWFNVAGPEFVPDRETLAPAGPLRRAARSVVLDFALPLAPVINASNAGTVLYYGAFALPAALLFGLGRRVMRRRPRSPTTDEARTIVLAVLALSLTLVFVRHPINARLPDASGLMPLVLLATAAEINYWGFKWRALARIGMVVTLLAVLLHGRAWNRLYDAGAFRGPAAVAAQYARTWSVLRTPPWEDFWPIESLPNSIHYLRACTTESDRVLVTWFAPEVFAFTDRGFAAGHSYFIRRSFFGLDYQRQMVDRLEREHVPIALINLEQGWFSMRFRLLQQYLDREYRVVGTDRFRNELVAVAIRRRSRPTGIYAETGWPCFQ